MLKVCLHCLMAIESREGNQFARQIYIDDEEEMFCDWCENIIYDGYYYEI